MSGIERRGCDIRCDGCGRESLLMAESVTAARELMRSGGWQYYRKKNAGYDKCPKCQPPPGPDWKRAG